MKINKLNISVASFKCIAISFVTVFCIQYMSFAQESPKEEDFFKINKVNVYSLRNQLKSGNIKAIQRIESNSTNMKKDNGPRGYSQRQPLNLKITKPQENSGEKYNFLSDTSPSLVIKISGIWETDVNVGITFKFQM